MRSSFDARDFYHGLLRHILETDAHVLVPRCRRQREELRLEVLEKARAEIRRLAPDFPGLREVHLFGSVTEPDRFTRNSDIDLAVESDDLEQETPFARALEEVLDRPVDVRPHTGPIRTAVETSGETDCL